VFRLSYARAEKIAPLLERMLPPQARITYDTRTNTLLVSY
jgi:type II secretory pathway component GspD/PulD (secretin)